jgi:hypothetical protein
LRARSGWTSAEVGGDLLDVDLQTAVGGDHDLLVLMDAHGTLAAVEDHMEL